MEKFTEINKNTYPVKLKTSDLSMRRIFCYLLSRETILPIVCPVTTSKEIHLSFIKDIELSQTPGTMFPVSIPEGRQVAVLNVVVGVQLATLCPVVVTRHTVVSRDIIH
jgi:hypothetical protein